MIRAPRNLPKEKGAALIVVLLLVATLSFILLSVSGLVSASARRSAADRAHSDFDWRAAAGERIAEEMLEKYLKTKPPKMTPTEGIFARPIEAPIEDGKATILFRDATGCFNVNNLVAGSAGSYAENPVAIEGFISLLQSIGLGAGEASKVADVIVDFIDSDDMTRGQGAEDGFYTALPTPYRTSGQLIQSMSELRAMDGVTRSLYRRIRPYLCAEPTTDEGALNINMAGPEHAPILLARLPAGSDGELSALRSQLAAMPPGGVLDANLLDPPLSAVRGLAFTSDRIEAVVRLEVNGRAIEEKLLFEAKQGGDLKLLARTFGEDF